MVESGGLENRCARKGTEGSNPSPSASSARVPLAVIADSICTPAGTRRSSRRGRRTPAGRRALRSITWTASRRPCSRPSPSAASSTTPCSIAPRGPDADVAAAIAIAHDGDCGIFNVSTFEKARRRGLGAAMTLRLLRDGAGRGCTTASLQPTEIAERVYAAAGFPDLARLVEHVPAGLIRSG